MSFSTEPTVGLFSTTALARWLKVSDECVKTGWKLGQIERGLNS
jgi:hypothetical protein